MPFIRSALRMFLTRTCFISVSIRSMVVMVSSGTRTTGTPALPPGRAPAVRVQVPGQDDDRQVGFQRRHLEVGPVAAGDHRPVALAAEHLDGAVRLHGADDDALDSHVLVVFAGEHLPVQAFGDLPGGDGLQRPVLRDDAQHRHHFRSK